MTYFATLSFDYSQTRSNQYTQLVAAILDAGWEWSETSTYHVESDSLIEVRRAFDLLSRAVEDPGILSSLNLNVHLITPRGRPAAHRHAIEHILDMPTPTY